MDIKEIRSYVQNYEICSIDEIEEILNFIADRKRRELEIDFEFEIAFDTGGRVKPERTPTGYQQVEIGDEAISEIKERKEFKRLQELGLIDSDFETPEVEAIEERKEFIELILQTFHELRHVKQNDNMQDKPIENSEMQKMTREKIINESFPGFRNRFNYEESMLEIDAMKTSLEETVKFFQEMGADISADEVFSVMKEKELCYLDYDLQKFGDSYESAMEYFNKIYGKIREIKGVPEIIQDLSEDKRKILDSQCQELLDSFYSETDMERKMDLLKEMSLIMSPELRQKYPLADIQMERTEETGIRLNSVNGRLIEKYNKSGVNRTDLANAKDILSMTKNEMEQVEDKTNKFEGR